MHYDHISFHVDDEFPGELSPNAATHLMGYFFAWAVQAGLHSEAVAALPDFDTLKNGALTGAQFVQQQLGGGIDDTCFNALGNRFVQYYYDDEEEGYGAVMQDYVDTVQLSRYPTFYHIPDNRKLQLALNETFQAAFKRWHDSLK